MTNSSLHILVYLVSGLGGWVFLEHGRDGVSLFVVAHIVHEIELSALELWHRLQGVVSLALFGRDADLALLLEKIEHLSPRLCKIQHD